MFGMGKLRVFCRMTKQIISDLHYADSDQL